MTATQSFPCPHCAAVYELDAAYIAAYGGQATQCRRCQQVMVIPSSAIPTAAPPVAVMPAATPGPYGQPSAGYPPYASAIQPSPMAAMPLGYAGGFQSNQAFGWTVLRERHLVVADHRAEFPPYCVKCGEPIQHPPIRRRIGWAHPLLYLTFFAGLLVMVIVMVLATKYCTVRIGLCERHRRRWKTDLTIGYCLLGATLLPIPVAIILENGWPMIASPVFLIAGLIMTLGAKPILRARRCDGQRIWLTGASEQFLQMLPTTEQAAAAQAAQYAPYYQHHPGYYPPAGGWQMPQ